MLIQMVCLADYFVSHFKVPGILCGCVQDNVQQDAAVNAALFCGRLVRRLGCRLRGRSGGTWGPIDVMEPTRKIPPRTRLGWVTGILAQSRT